MKTPLRRVQNIRPAVVTVGDELIFGEQQNANQQWLAKILWEKGIPSKLSLVLPDEISAIAGWIRELRHKKHDLILVSGGIGGTHDDCTREGIAKGLDVELEQHKECLDILTARAKTRKFEITPLIERMTFLPAGCELIENETGMPGFHLNGVYAFPGFPNMLKPMATQVLNGLVPEQVDNWITKEVILPMAESVVGPYIETYLDNNPHVKIGLYPDSTKCHRQVKIKFRASIDNKDALARFDDLLNKIITLI